MIHQVKVFTPDGKLKRIDSAEECQKKYWSDFGKNNSFRQGNGEAKPPTLIEEEVKDEA